MTRCNEARQKLLEQGEQFNDDWYIVFGTSDEEGNEACIVNDVRGNGFKVKDGFLCTVINDVMRIFSIVGKYSGWFNNGCMLTNYEFYVCE